LGVIAGCGRVFLIVRKAVLAALAAPSRRSVCDIAAVYGRSS
jgi:hypothetical protein